MIPINEAQHQLQQSIAPMSQSHQPIAIAGQTSNAVLLCESDSASVARETLYLLSVPGMRGSIREGLVTPIDRGLRSLFGVVRRADHTCHNQPYSLVRDRLNLWMR